MHINHMPNLTREMKRILLSYGAEKFPYVVYFNKGMEHPQFKITIERAEIDTFTDANGQKWKKIT